MTSFDYKRRWKFLREEVVTTSYALTCALLRSATTSPAQTLFGDASSLFGGAYAAPPGGPMPIIIIINVIIILLLLLLVVVVRLLLLVVVVVVGGPMGFGTAGHSSSSSSGAFAPGHACGARPAAQAAPESIFKGDGDAASSAQAEVPAA